MAERLAAAGERAGDTAPGSGTWLSAAHRYGHGNLAHRAGRRQRGRLVLRRPGRPDRPAAPRRRHRPAGLRPGPAAPGAGPVPRLVPGPPPGLDLDGDRGRRLDAVFETLIEAALAQPRVFVHRDFMPRNLMVSDPNPG
ncbi:phosphotransferase [Alcanivorax sp. IO_7]|nr:phosphotransferase [Alcanivorax sp. IO_7]